MNVFARNKDLFSDVSAVVTAAVFIFGLLQYRKSQSWKRNEFLAKEMKEFLYDKLVQDTLYMMEYYGRRLNVTVGGKQISIYVFHNEEELPADSELEMHTSLHNALRSGNTATEITDAEQQVRDRFDRYFSGLERFQTFQTNKLVTKDEIGSYLDYHFRLVNGLVDHSRGFHEVLFRYLACYDFDRALQLLASFPQSTDVKRYSDAARQI